MESFYYWIEVSDTQSILTIIELSESTSTIDNETIKKIKITGNDKLKLTI